MTMPSSPLRPRRRAPSAPSRRPPEWLRRRRRSAKSQSRDKRDWVLLATVAAAALPGIAAVVALFLTFQSIQETNWQLQIDQQGQVTDRYNAAITNLGSRSVEVRLGGIYALQRLMEDSPRDQPTIVAVLCAFVRNETTESVIPVASESPEWGMPTDIAAAIAVVANRDINHDGHNRIAKISRIFVDFSGAKLVDANLRVLKLRSANFSDADLRSAHFSFANADKAAFDGADLTDADFTFGQLAFATFGGSKLRRTDLSSANLAHAEFDGADLHGADLSGTDLIYTTFSDANLSGADFEDAKVKVTSFVGANLTNALWSAGTPVPPGWTRDPRTGRLHKATGSG